MTSGKGSRLPMDTPNHRSLHSTPVPRSGGIGILLGLLTSAVIIPASAPVSLWIAVALLAFTSIVDDFRTLPAGVRLAAHLLAAGFFVAPILVNHGAMYVAAATLGIAWMANLYNFMDGSDGLAGGMAVSGFSCFAIAALNGGNAEFALLNASIAASAAAFLIFNFPPARIFMGDSGSVPLGFLAGALGLLGWTEGYWPWWFTFLVFSPFIVDASTTLLRRLLARTRIWEAHRDHYYQRVVRMGFGHRNTALLEYCLMAISGIAALLMLKMNTVEQITILSVFAVGYLILIAAIEYRWRQRSANNE